MITMFRRSFRGGRRSRGPKPVVQSFKKVLNFASASFTAGFQQELLAKGTDSVAAGQPTATNAEVPTGSSIRFFEIQFAVNNSVATPCYVNCSIQYTLDGQTVVDPDLVGGDKMRNQVLHQDLFTVGTNQNSTHKFKFKIPPKFQRIREGMSWLLVWSNSATVNREAQLIYKFYR